MATVTLAFSTFRGIAFVTLVAISCAQRVEIMHTHIGEEAVSLLPLTTHVSLPPQVVGGAAIVSKRR